MFKRLYFFVPNKLRKFKVPLKFIIRINNVIPIKPISNHNITFKYYICVKPAFDTHHYLIDDLKFHNANERKNKQNAVEQDHDLINIKMLKMMRHNKNHRLQFLFY